MERNQKPSASPPRSRAFFALGVGVLSIAGGWHGAIKAVIPSELVAQLREAAEPAEDIEETVQGAIQMTLPTAEVNFSPQASEVTVQIPDDQMISALLGMALYELQHPQ